MTVDELTRRFPQIPVHLTEEPVLEVFGRAFGDVLRSAEKPSNCTTDHSAEHKTYLKLMGPIDIHCYGLYSRDRVIAELEKLVAVYEEDPEAFVSHMLESGAAG